MDGQILPIPAMVPVKSSAMAAHGYDDKTNTLAIQFKANGPTYLYAGVPLELYLKLQSAESFGRFFAAEIKGKFGEPRRVDPPPADPAVNLEQALKQSIDEGGAHGVGQ